jgi:hypothetical protein
MQILGRESMKRSVKPVFAQMNLALGMLTTANLDDQQKDLIVALMELLVSAAETQAEEGNEQPGNGGENESEAHA